MEQQVQFFKSGPQADAVDPFYAEREPVARVVVDKVVYVDEYAGEERKCRAAERLEVYPYERAYDGGCRYMGQGAHGLPFSTA